MIHLSREGWEGGGSRVIAEGGDRGVHWVMASLPKMGAGVQSRPHKASESGNYAYSSDHLVSF